MKRRAFLLLPLALSTVSTARLFAAPSTSSRFLLVFLRGGYDAANVLIPHSSDYYYQARPNIAVPRDAVLKLDSDWALHPALRESLYAMWLRGEAAFVPFAGSHDLSRSHFESQDTLELGQPLGGGRGYDSGFMGRLAAALGASRAIAFTNNMPLAFRGPTPEGAKPVANIALGGAGLRPAAVDSRQSALISEMYRDSKLGSPVSEAFAMRESVMRDLGAEMEAAGRNAINARGFELQARRIAKLMQGEYNLGFVDVGGWDTHVGEGGQTGQLATRLEELGRGLSALAQGMGSVWRDTVVVVVSEFGRTFRENGNRGTDHGHGTVYWLLGGALRGGVRGRQVSLSEKTLFQNRDYPVLNEYRALLGGVFARLYGLSSAQLERVFPGVSPENLQLL